VAATFIETLDGLPNEDKNAIGLDSDIQNRISRARRRAEIINRTGTGLFAIARKYECSNAESAWDNPGSQNALTIVQRSDFISVALFDKQNFIDMVCFVPDNGARPIGEGRNAFMTESIFADQQLKNWLMSLYKSFDNFNLVSRIFIRNNLRKVLSDPGLSNRFENSKASLINSSTSAQDFKNRQREIENELAMRVARLHNGGSGALSSDPNVLLRRCVRNGPTPCDLGNYVKIFIGIDSARGDWRSLRCGEIDDSNGIEVASLIL
jgi:hypothetical protein